MNTTGQFYLIKSDGITRRTFIIVEETLSLYDLFDREEPDNLETIWHSDLYGLPEC